MGIIAVITNPNAKRNRKERGRYRHLRKILGDRGTVIETPIPEDLTPVVNELINQDISVLGICGGDGTMQHTLTAFIKAYGGKLPPLVLPLKGGTMNTIGKSVGLIGTAEQNLEAIVRKYDAGEPFSIATRDTMCANGKYCFLFGNGLVANFLDAYYGSPYDGSTAALYVIARGVGCLLTRSDYYHRLYDPIRAKVTVDDEVIPFNDFLGVLSATVRDLGVGFQPMYLAEEKDGTMHVVVAGISPAKAVMNLGKLFKGKPIPSDRYLDRLAKRLVIQSERSYKFQADGEIYEADHVEITMGPMVRIITG